MLLRKTLTSSNIIVVWQTYILTKNFTKNRWSNTKKRSNLILINQGFSLLWGLAYAKLNKLEQASEMFLKTLKIEPNNEIALSGLNFIKTFNKT